MKERSVGPIEKQVRSGVKPLRRYPADDRRSCAGCAGNGWFWDRPSVVDLWHDLREVTSEIRPDWDLSTPGLRKAWNAGDFPPFHGWNKMANAKVAPADRKAER
jgi:hypothetical protein